MIEAHVLTVKCHDGSLHGIRVEKQGNGWKMTWNFPIRQSVAEHEGYDKTTINGNIIPAENYNGCPVCNAKYFLVCSCGKLSCYNNEENVVCNWCGLTGKATTLSDMDIKSSKF